MDDKQIILYFFVAICLWGQRKVSASCEQVDVGVSWYILDNQLKASSELNANTPAKNGRLKFVAGSSWCASTSDSSPYLQIDLRIPISSVLYPLRGIPRGVSG
ncbi:unnamed protein product [Porites evermanni]|uniref:F5/8 type C domain-containing protein n=1 Tax=Porites evermanni TaxID=104178 RepID=A0ABN8SVD9_9CNID|nr:unnamed protein product [Porites evermanni]